MLLGLLFSGDVPDYYKHQLFNELYFLVDGGCIWSDTDSGVPNNHPHKGEMPSGGAADPVAEIQSSIRCLPIFAYQHVQLLKCRHFKGFSCIPIECIAFWFAVCHTMCYFTNCRECICLFNRLCSRDYFCPLLFLHVCVRACEQLREASGTES